MLTISNQLRVTEPDKRIMEYCKDKLTISNPEYAKKVRLGLWTGSTPKQIKLYSKDGDDVIIPYGCLSDVIDYFDYADIKTELPTPTRLNYGKYIPLYDYQETAVKKMIDARFGILQSAAGSGKTQMGLALIQRLGKKALWLTHTKDLLVQSKARAEQYMDKSIMGTITEGKVEIGKGITFATVQTMCNLDLSLYRDVWDVVVVDECFPKGTLIQTEQGEIPIEDVLPGMKVITVDDDGNLTSNYVCETRKRRPQSLGKIELSNGSTIISTLNHPYLTKDGWKQLKEVTTNDELLYLRKGTESCGLQRKHTKFNAVKRVRFLFRCLPKRTSKTGDDKNEQRICIEQNEGPQPYAFVRKQGKGFGNFKSNASSPARSRWKRKGSYNPAENTCRETVGSVTYNGTCDTYENQKGKRISNLLQDRHCHSRKDDCNRDRRFKSLLNSSTETGCKENGIFEWVRVENIAVHEQTSDGRFGNMCSDGYVYNMSVCENHNYFANNILVHNCHRACGTATSVTMFSKILNNLSARHKYGLSATVHRADGLIQATFSLIGPVQYIVPEEATAKKTMQVTIQPIQTGVELTNVCFNYDGTLKFASMLTFLATNEWRNELITRYLIMNRGHSILVLSSRLEQLRILFDKLPYEMKSDAVMIDGSMTSKKAKAEREQAIEDMRTGNKHILFASYGLAKEGLDIPCLDRLFLATPEKDYAVITQSIGRIARTCDGKGTPVCYDFVDAHSVLASMCRKRYQTYKKNKCEVLPFE